MIRMLSNLRLPELNRFLSFNVCAISIIKGFFKSLWAFLSLSCLFLTSLVFNCYLTIVLIFSWSQNEKPGSRCDCDSLPLSPAAAQERKRPVKDARLACTPLTPEQRCPRGGPRAGRPRARRSAHVGVSTQRAPRQAAPEGPSPDGTATRRSCMVTAARKHGFP